MMNAEQKQFVQLLRRYLKRNTARYQRWNELGDRPQFSLTPDEMAEFQRMDRSLRAEIFLDMPERLLQIIDAQQAVIEATRVTYTVGIENLSRSSEPVPDFCLQVIRALGDALDKGASE
jgi:hypothetical protein